MNRILLTIIAFIAPFLIGAFTRWSFDISTWQEISRFFAVMFGSTAAAITYLELDR